MEFECRYIHDQDFNMALFHQVLRQNVGTYIFWSLLLAFSVFIMCYGFAHGTGVDLRTAVYVVFITLSLYQLISPSVLVRRTWKKNCAKWGREKFQILVTFGNSVRLSDDTGMEADVPWYKVAEFRKAGDFLLVRGEEAQRGKKPKKVDYLYCPLSGFADGTGRALRDWMREHHPKIPLKGWEEETV